MNWCSRGCHGYWYYSWHRMHHDDWVVQDGGHTPLSRLTDMSYHTSLILDIHTQYHGHPIAQLDIHPHKDCFCCCFSRYGQLAPVKTRYTLTCIMWPYHGLKLRINQGHYFKLTADQVLVFSWIAGSCQVSLLQIVVQKPVNADPGVKLNQSINFSSNANPFTAFVLCS